MQTPDYLCKGKYVSLREMGEGDADALVAWRNEPETARWLIQWTPLTTEQHLGWFRQARQRGDSLFVFDLPDGTPIGAASIYGFDHFRTTAEWGRLCVAARAKYPLAVLEGSYLIHRFAFDLLGVRRLHCSAASENVSALRLDTWLGYTREGLRRQHLCTPDGYRDVVEFGMLTAEFAVKRQETEQMLYKTEPLPTWTDAAAGFAESLGRE